MADNGHTRGPFDTATRRRDNARRNASPTGRFFGVFGTFGKYGKHIVVCVAVVAVLVGGALYSARFSENAPRVVYSFSLDEVEAEVAAPLVIDINTADAEEMEELPQVGPSTAEEIIAFRRANGDFDAVSGLEEVPGIGPSTVEEIAPLATV